MKEEIYTYFIGTAGSGKSTLSDTFQKWLKIHELDSIIVNLDPGADNLPYEPNIDIRDWISLEEIMESYELGPNGAQIACADLIALNTSEIKESIQSFKTDYVIIDTPGQLELFVFRESGKYIIDFLNPEKSIIGYILDPALTKTPTGFISQLLLSMSANFRLGYPQINILSKSDLIPEEEIKKILSWTENNELLTDAINLEKPSIYNEMSEGLLNIMNSFENQAIIYPTGKTGYKGIDDIYTTIQLRFKGGEDILSD